MAQYRKKSVLVEAFHYQGPSAEFEAWADKVDAPGLIGIQPVGAHREEWCAPDWPLRLMTVQGEWVTCRVGEYIICENVPNRFYPCQQEAFEYGFEQA